MLNIEIKSINGYSYAESKISGEPLILLHGLFGSLSNFDGIMETLGEDYRVLIPIMPIADSNIPRKQATIKGLLNFIDSFIVSLSLQKVNILGNSLGGHIALLYYFREPHNVKSLCLTGSSGLFESAFGNGFPKRENYEFIAEGVRSTFYHPEVATKELIDDVFRTVNDRSKAIRIISTAKSAIRHNVENQLESIDCPCLIVWGRNDTITPIEVGERFHELIKDSQLVIMDNCGHAPMMEYPVDFGTILKDFLEHL